MRRINEQINGMVGTKMIIFAVLGLLAIGGVNVVFYKMIKEELKKRKLIWSLILPSVNDIEKKYPNSKLIYN